MQFTAVPAEETATGQVQPKVRSNARQLTKRFYLVFGVFALAALAGIGSIFAWISTAQQMQTVEIPPVSKGQTLATDVAQAWVRGEPLPHVPVGAGMNERGIFGDTTPSFSQQTNGALGPLSASVTWMSFEPHTLPDDRVLEVHRFRWGTASDARGVIAVTLFVGPLGPELAGPPALEPVPANIGTQTSNALLYNFTCDDLPQSCLRSDAANRALASWAEAFVTNDVVTLQGLMGTSAAVSGIGVDNLIWVTSATNPMITSSYATGDGRMLAQVQVTFKEIRNPDRVDLGAAPDPGPEFSAAYDVVLVNAGPDSPTPQVFAWGPVGTGIDLLTRTG